MINTDILKNFESDSKTTIEIIDIEQVEECSQESIKIIVNETDKNNVTREKKLVISSELDIDESGYYKSKLTGYQNKENKYRYKPVSKETTIDYPTENNSLVPNSGVTVQNIDFSNLFADVIKLSDYGKELLCGNLLDNLFLNFKKDNDNTLLIIDFDGIEEVSENFLKTLIKYLLQTSNKVIPINMSTAVSNDFSSFIAINLWPEGEVDELYYTE